MRKLRGNTGGLGDRKGIKETRWDWEGDKP